MSQIPEAFQKTHDAAPKSRKMAILAFCAECMGYDTNPKDCTAPNCPLYKWRGWKRSFEQTPAQAKATQRNIRKALAAAKKPQKSTPRKNVQVEKR